MSKLIEPALAGEEVSISKGPKPVARLVAIPQAEFKLGVLAGQVGAPPDFLQTSTDEELKAWEAA